MKNRDKLLKCGRILGLNYTLSIGTDGILAKPKELLAEIFCFEASILVRVTLKFSRAEFSIIS